MLIVLVKGVKRPMWPSWWHLIYTSRDTLGKYKQKNLAELYSGPTHFSWHMEKLMFANLHCQSSLNSRLALLFLQEQMGGCRWARYLDLLERTGIKWCDNCGSRPGCLSLPPTDRVCRDIHFVLSRQRMFVLHCFLLEDQSAAAFSSKCSGGQF